MIYRSRHSRNYYFSGFVTGLYAALAALLLVIDWSKVEQQFKALGIETEHPF